MGRNSVAGLNESKPIRVDIPTTKKITKLIASAGFYSVLDEDGKLYNWGTNPQGQLGNGTWISSNIPSLIDLSNFDGKIIDVSSYGASTLALTDKGSVYSWGRNQRGELGLGDTINRSLPEKVNLPVKIKK